MQQLNQSLKYIDRALSFSENNRQDLLQNKAAILVARYHASLNVQHLRDALALFGQEKREDSRTSFKIHSTLRYNDLIAMTVGYLKTLQLMAIRHENYRKSGASVTNLEDYPDYKEEINIAARDAHQIIQSLQVGRPSSYWQEELAVLGKAVENMQCIPNSQGNL